MDKYWYLIVEGATLGPFSAEELAAHPGFSPDALVWTEGFADWVEARDVMELKDLFKDKNHSSLVQMLEPEEEELPDTGGEAVLEAKSEPPFLMIWFVIALLIFIYLLFLTYSGG